MNGKGIKTCDNTIDYYVQSFRAIILAMALITET